MIIGSISENQDLDNKDIDKGINMGLYCYPILMAADILTFNANKIPVGKDQYNILKWLEI